MKEKLRRKNSPSFSRQAGTASLPGVSVGYCQRVLVDETGMIETQMGNTIDQ
jgi:hypothetical protein